MSKSRDWGRCGIFPITHNGGWPVLAIIPFGIVANARKGQEGSKQRVVEIYCHFAGGEDIIIDFDDLGIGEVIRTATQDEIDDNEIRNYPAGHKR